VQRKNKNPLLVSGNCKHQVLNANVHHARQIKETLKGRATSATFIISDLLNGNAERFGKLLLGKLHLVATLVDECAEVAVAGFLLHRVLLNWVRVNWVRVNWVRVNWVRVNWVRVNWVRVNWVRVNWVRVKGTANFKPELITTELNFCLSKSQPSTSKSENHVFSFLEW